MGYTDTTLDVWPKGMWSLLGCSLEFNGAMEPTKGAPRATAGPGGSAQQWGVTAGEIDGGRDQQECSRQRRQRMLWQTSLLQN